jgi:hypothetical protein
MNEMVTTRRSRRGTESDPEAASRPIASAQTACNG